MTFQILAMIHAASAAGIFLALSLAVNYASPVQRMVSKIILTRCLKSREGLALILLLVNRTEEKHIPAGILAKM
jgi:hypothetical protein